MNRPLGKLRVAADYQARLNGVHLHAWVETPNGDVAAAMPATFESEPSGGFSAMPAPVLTLDRNACQALLDDLWRAGFRPGNGNGNEGKADAMAAHLADLRDIARHALKMPIHG